MSDIKIQIKNRYSGEVLFEHSCKNNTIKLTLQLAVESNADLSYADLSYADLSYADLSYANLSYANLSYANLSYADLSYADLSYADLSAADLSAADLRNADLRNADLSAADLSYANLRNADLSAADLSYANLRNANLSAADLSYANLSYATGNGIHIISAQIAKYRIVFTSEFMWIGYRKHPIQTWWKDSEKDVDEFNEKEKQWRKDNKRWINAFVNANPAQPTKPTSEGDV